MFLPQIAHQLQSKGETAIKGLMQNRSARRFAY